MSDRKENKTPPRKSKAFFFLGIISAVFLVLTLLGIWLMREYLSDPEAVRARIGEHYVLGAITLVILTAVQVIVALIPSELLEIAAGYVFGSWMGALLCLVGIVLGSCVTILLVRKFGAKFVYALYPKEKIDALPEVLDVDTAPEEMLPVFASWMGLETDEMLFSPEELRKLLKITPQLMERKGSKWAVETAVRLFVPGDVYIVERNLLMPDQRRSEELYGESVFDFTVMVGQKMDEKLRLRLQFLIDQLKPIRSRYRIVFLEDSSGLDSFMYLDVNGAVLQNTAGKLDDGKALTGMTYLE